MCVGLPICQPWFLHRLKRHRGKRPDASVAADAAWPNGPKSLGRRRRRVTGSILFKSTGISISPDFPRIGSEKMHETPYLKVPQMLHEYANQHLP